MYFVKHNLPGKLAVCSASIELFLLESVYVNRKIPCLCIQRLLVTCRWGGTLNLAHCRPTLKENLYFGSSCPPFWHIKPNLVSSSTWVFLVLFFFAITNNFSSCVSFLKCSADVMFLLPSLLCQLFLATLLAGLPNAHWYNHGAIAPWYNSLSL